MKPFTKNRAWTAFGLTLTVLLINAAVTFRNVLRVVDNEGWVAHTHEVLTAMEATLSWLKDAETGQRGYLITGEAAYSQHLEAATAEVHRQVVRVRELTVDNPRQQEHVRALDRLASARLDMLHDVVRLRKDQGVEAARQTLQSGQGERRTDEFRVLLDQMQTDERELLKRREQESVASLHLTLITFSVITLLGMGLLGLSFYLVRRDLVERRRAEEALRRAFDSLEVKVQKRTAALTAANEALQAEIRKRASAEEALQQSEERFRLLVEGVKDYAIIRLLTDGRVASWNAGAERIKGYKAEEIIGRHFSNFYPKREKCWPEHKLERAAAEGRFEDEAWQVRKDGSKFWANVIITALRDEAGNLTGFAKVTRDVTERKLAEEKATAFAERLQRSNKELEQFASVASHDLQEPLRKIQAFGDRLQSKCGEALGDQGREYLERIQTSVARMRTLINDLLTFSRVTIKAKPFAPVDLGRVVREVVSDLDGRIEQTGGRVEADDLPTVDADPMQMRQLLQNLIGNGLKFHRPGEPPVVRVQGNVLSGMDRPFNGDGRNDPLVRISVADNGIGFEETYLDRIFQLFQRLHGRQEYEGTGMGLAICRKIVERHGGSITAQSTPGRGATFIVTLPMKQQEEEPDHDEARDAHHHPDGR